MQFGEILHWHAFCLNACHGFSPSLIAVGLRWHVLIVFIIAAEFWRQDYTIDELFTAGVTTSSAPTWRNNTPTIAYVTPDSDLSFLQRFWVPTKPDAKNGLRMEQRVYATRLVCLFC